MNYDEAISYIHSIPKFSRVLGNEMLARLLAHMGNPERELKFIHIAGTNGKGSVAKMLSCILAEAGYNTGLFTSPYLERFNERISINGADITDADLARIVTRVRAISEENDAPVSEFAFDTACALKYFSERKCDVVVWETGLGGRLDATNIVENKLVTVFTKIGFDHMQYLGDTIEQIAAEKCGIMREGVTAVSAPCQTEAALSVIRDTAEHLESPLIITEEPTMTDGGFIYKGREYPLNLGGAYQGENAAAVCETVGVLRGTGFDIPEDAVCRALSSVEWHARFERLDANVYLDGAHNIDGIRALKRSLEALKKPVFIFTAMMEDKAWRECMCELLPVSAGAAACEVDMPRCLPKERISELAAKLGIDCREFADNRSAIQYARKLAEQGRTVCFCGSLYFAGEIRRLWRENNFVENI